MKEGILTGGFIDVERLRIVPLSETYDLSRGEPIALLRIKSLARIEVFEIKFRLA